MKKTQCTRPLIRAETYRSYINKKGGKSYEVEWLDPNIFEGVDPRKQFGWWTNHYRKVEKVPCGQCINCKLNYARDKATLIMLEKTYHEDAWFITLTYKDEYLTAHQTYNTETGEIYTGMSLNVHDLQKFIKKIRKHFPECKIKYIAAGEYGSHTMRPHFHIIIFGLKLDPHLFKKVGINKMGDPLWTTPEIEKIWGKGNITIGEVTWRSACYVARYTLKKMDGNRTKEWYMAQGLKPEFIAWSNGIGNQYFQDHQERIYITDAVPILNEKTGQPVKPPKKFNTLLKEVDPKLYENIKYRRMSEGFALDQSLSTDIPKWQYLKNQENKKKSNFKDIRRL